MFVSGVIREVLSLRIGLISYNKHKRAQPNNNKTWQAPEVKEAFKLTLINNSGWMLNKN